MNTEYIVLDPEGDVTCNDKTRSAESFKTFRGPKGAAARAMEVAKMFPGRKIRIFELTAEAVAPFKAVEVSRKHPTEHYK